MAGEVPPRHLRELPLGVGTLSLDSAADCFESRRPSLQTVLALFDGSRSVKEVVRSLERAVQPFGANIVVFLLR